MSAIRVNIQKRFADSDIFGHINNVNLQHYFDIGKVDYIKQRVGVDVIDGSRGFITASTTTNYFAQTKYVENVCVETSVEKIGTKSFTIFQNILSVETGEIKAESRSVFVAFDFEKQESIEIPEQWKIQLK